MYKLTIRYKSESPKEIISDVDGLFFLCCLLDKSELVIEFKVETHQPKDFGWGDFEKWVQKFDWSKK
jgi:hypothetical protein